MRRVPVPVSLAAAGDRGEDLTRLRHPQGSLAMMGVRVPGHGGIA
jgi:hypothetical protein